MQVSTGDRQDPRAPLERTVCGCLGKVQYETEQAAIDMRRRCEQKRNTGLRIYRCELCSCWHLGRTMGMSCPPRCGTCLERFAPRSRDDWQCSGCRP